MALVLADRVQQTGTANTTVSFTLSGSVTGYQSFAVVGNGNTTYYAATDTSGNWEVGIGTYSTTGPTLTRTTVVASSNSGSAVTFSGTVNVFVTYPAEKSVNLDGSGNVSALGTVSSGVWQGTAVAVGYGGTGLTTLTAGYIPYGNGTGAFSSSANMTFNGSTLTTLNTAYTGTLTGGTGIVNLGSGQFYKDASGNVGIGTSSPSSKLEAVGTITASSTTTLPSVLVMSNQAAGFTPPNIQMRRAGAGGTTTPDSQTLGQIRFDGLSTGSVYDNAAFIQVDSGVNASGGMPSIMTFGTATSGANAVERMRIDSSGNVGIGTTSPLTNNARLSLKANGDYDAGLAIGSNSSAANWARLDFQNTNAASPAIIYQDQLGTLAIRTDGAYPITFYTNGSNERMRIDSSGNVGIGTSSPNTKFTVNGNANLTGNLYTPDYGYIGNSGGTFSGINTGFQTLSGGSGYLLALTNGNERMRIDSSGNVGIGTSSPSAKLTIASNAGGYALQTAGTVNDYFGMSVYNSNAGSSARSYLQLGNDASQYATFISLNSSTNTAIGGANSLNIYQGLTAPLTFSTAGTERARIDSSGNLLIGYTSSNGSYKLQVNSQIFATSSTIATSDARYKENVEELSGALDIVKSLRPVSFDWKVHPIHNFDTKTKTVGFLAQDVQQTLAGKPYLNSIIKTNECVIEPEVKDENGTVTKEAVTEEFLGIAEGNMISILTAAIKELKAEFDAYVIAHP